MFELPELIVLSRQIGQHLGGKRVTSASYGNSAHKFAWYNHPQDEFAALAAGKTIGARPIVRGRWLLVPFEPGYHLVLGEFGGRLLLHPPGAPLPPKYHLHLGFEDGAALTLTIQMWGAMELYPQGEEQQRMYIKDMRPVPLDPAFTPDYFAALTADLAARGAYTAKALLTQEQLIPGLGNSIAQEILFKAGLHPKHPLRTLTPPQVRRLYDQILASVEEIAAQGGRSDEVDLFGNPGGYQRLMDSAAPGKPCPVCSGRVEKMQYLGGACYFCPACQE